MILPVFIQKHHIKEIDTAILEGDYVLEYDNCEGINPEIYDEYKQMLLNHKEQGKKIIEKGVSKQLRKLIKKLEFKDRY